MLNAAADVNRRRMDLRIKERSARGEDTWEDNVADMPLVNGKRLDELTSDEYLNYVGGPRPRVIKVPKASNEQQP